MPEPPPLSLSLRAHPVRVMKKGRGPLRPSNQASANHGSRSSDAHDKPPSSAALTGSSAGSTDSIQECSALSVKTKGSSSRGATVTLSREKAEADNSRSSASCQGLTSDASTSSAVSQPTSLSERTGLNSTGEDAAAAGEIMLTDMAVEVVLLLHMVVYMGINVATLHGSALHDVSYHVVRIALSRNAICLLFSAAHSVHCTAQVLLVLLILLRRVIACFISVPALDGHKIPPSPVPASDLLSMPPDINGGLHAKAEGTACMNKTSPKGKGKGGKDGTIARDNAAQGWAIGRHVGGSGDVPGNQEAGDASSTSNVMPAGMIPNGQPSGMTWQQRRPLWRRKRAMLLVRGCMQANGDGMTEGCLHPHAVCWYVAHIMWGEIKGTLQFCGWSMRPHTG